MARPDAAGQRIYAWEGFMPRFKGFAAIAAASVLVTAGVMASATPAEAGRKTGFHNSKLAKYGHFAPRGHYGHRSYGHVQQYRHGGYHRGNRGIATGVGIAAGALAIGALAGAFSQPAYAEPVYHQQFHGYGYAQPVIYRPPVCRVRYQTVWDPYYGYVQQPVRVCR
jgi:hypothetical protein